MAGETKIPRGARAVTLPPNTLCRTCRRAVAVGWRWPPTASVRWACCGRCLAHHERVRAEGMSHYARQKRRATEAKRYRQLRTG